METRTPHEQIVHALSPNQKAAAIERSRDVIVKAGAGSGKTRTLVARYLSLLDDGVSPSEIAAITFTEKAALEMQTRVRVQLKEIADTCVKDHSRERWLDLLNEMDGARIGTIHSLCSQILRANPAEASLDPNFTVLDEGQSALLIAEIVEETVIELSESDDAEPLLTALSGRQLTELLTELLQKRLDVTDVLPIRGNLSTFFQDRIRDYIAQPIVRDFRNDFGGIPYEELKRDAGDVNADRIVQFLTIISNVERMLSETCDSYAMYEQIWSCVNNWNLNQGKRTHHKESIKTLRESTREFFSWLNPGKNKSLRTPEEENEYDEVIDCCRRLFPRLVARYKQALADRNALDFDGLEENALAVLSIPEVRAKWQKLIRYVLVDEFQDTNARQTQLVRILANQPGKLFVVGDEKQSIYRFRRADVSVFAKTAEEIRRSGGLTIVLNETYRSHHELMAAMGSILEPAMNIPALADQPFYVPFEPLVSRRDTDPTLHKPFVEVLIGDKPLKNASDEPDNDTENVVDSSQEVMVSLLIQRLRELKAQGEIRDWDEVALLFRSASSFRTYEDAFEAASIPYITVAGKGFYERPEIRDILNMLRALANPYDDLALTGFLLSPVIGFRLDMLVRLRGQLPGAGPADEPLPLWIALQREDIRMDDDEAQSLRERTVQLISELSALAGRIPVDTLLERIYERTDYRTVLAMAGSERLWRNLDKLRRDARQSHTTVVSEFLDYIDNINVVGAREGEAASDRVGAVRLMTIHKSKGLEFPVVVLANANYKGSNHSPNLLLSKEFGLCLYLEPLSVKYVYAKQIDALENSAEMARLFYVAATRAQNRLIINGASPTAKFTKSAIFGSFLNETLNALEGIEAETTDASVLITRSDRIIETPVIPKMQGITTKPEWNGVPLLPPLYEEDEPLPDEATERTESRDDPDIVSHIAHYENEDRFGITVGSLVHKALELWLFPDDDVLLPVMQRMLINRTDLSESQRERALTQSLTLLTRFRAAPLYQEITHADRRFHELPYSLTVRTRKGHAYTQNGIIDLLMCKDETWTLIDFKSDAITSIDAYENVRMLYKRQLEQYTRAVRHTLNLSVTAKICFLDFQGEIHLMDLDALDVGTD